MKTAAKKILILALGLSLVLCAGNSLCFQNPDIKISTSASETTTGEYSRIACDSYGHVYAVWQDMRNGKDDIYFNYSADYGATWRTNDIRINTTPAGTEYAHYPQVCCDEHGHVYVVWLDGRGVSFNYSADYGATWSANDITVRESLGTRALDYPQISCDDSGRVYIVWQEAPRDGYGLTGYYAIYFNYSLDHGAGWSGEAIRLDTDMPQGGHSWNPKVSCDENGNVYSVWEDYRNGRPDIYFNCSSDYGQNWQEIDTRLDTDEPGRNQSTLPEISADSSGHVYVVWGDERIGGIYGNHSSDYGVHWQGSDTQIGHIAGLGGGGMPKIANDKNGHVHVVWDASGDDASQDIFINSSLDYGASWQANDTRVDTINAVASFSPEVSCDKDGRVYVVWCDSAEIHFNYSLDHGLAWQGADLRVDTNTSGLGVSSYPQVASDTGGNVYVLWDDTRDGQDQYNVYFNYSKIASGGNQSPILDPVGDKSVDAGELLQFTVTASDPDGDTLTYSATNLPPGAAFDPATRIFSWTPDITQIKSYPGVHFEVTDGKLTSGEDITITVNKPSISEYIIKWWGGRHGTVPTHETSRTQKATLEAFIAMFGQNPDTWEYLAGSWCYKGKLPGAVGIVFQDGNWFWFPMPSLLTMTGWHRSGHWDVYRGVTPPSEPAAQAIEAVQFVQAQAAALNPDAFKSANIRGTFLNNLNIVIKNIGAGHYAAALRRLQNNILAKTDGCAKSGAPDRNDWIRDAGSQNTIYPSILDAIAKVKELLK